MALLVICIIRPRRMAGLAGATCAGAFVSLALALGAMSLGVHIASRSLHPLLSVALFDVTGTIAHLPQGERHSRPPYRLR